MVGSITGTNYQMPAGSANGCMQTDSVSKELQNQIAQLQKQMQELSAKEDMTPEEKSEKKQELWQEITALNQQLKQHQQEQKQERQTKQNTWASSKESSCAAKEGRAGICFSREGVQAFLSADASLKQAKALGGQVVRMEGRSGVLEAEIKQDKGRGAGVEAKEKELADLQANIRKTTKAQISELFDAGKTMRKAADKGMTAEADGEDEKKQDDTEQAKEEKECLIESVYGPIDIRL